jgi:hypothetical protein
MLSLSPDRDRIACRPSHRRQATCLIFLLWATLSVCQNQGRSVLCNGGDGVLDVEFRPGFRLHVGAARNGQLATRACAAKLVWEKQELVVATGVAQLDVDAFGVDLGDGIPVAAFQIKKSDAECCMEYRIYSLEEPPRLLRTITGGEFFSASDMDLDGSVEIWTNDAAAVNGFENLALSELDSAPSVVFRMAHGKLLDVGAEFQSYFDGEIARIRAGIQTEDLRDFKASDGKLAATPATSIERLHLLRMTKIKVLEIVWAYLYSRRDPDAWRSLTEMWPPSDVDRIRAAIVAARTRGILSQCDRASAVPAPGRKKRAQIYDATNRSGPSRKLEVIPPKGILLQRPPTPDTEQKGLPESEALLDLLVDAAGKVRSAGPAGKEKTVDPNLINAALSWKFIPAFKDDRPVASRLRIAVSPRQ